MLDSKPHYIGHRKRLREKLLASKLGSLPDYEILELLLMIARPRIDVKPIAKSLLKKYDNLANLVAKDPHELSEEKNIGEAAITMFRVINEVVARVLSEDMKSKPLIESWKSLIDYCRATMAHISTEKFRILYLNSKNRLIADDLHEVGTVDHTPVYPREIAKRALLLNSSAVIIVHNHPSGDFNPSKADIEVTKKVVDALATVNVMLHDHVIVSKTGHYSFRTNGLV